MKSSVIKINGLLISISLSMLTSCDKPAEETTSSPSDSATTKPLVEPSRLVEKEETPKATVDINLDSDDDNLTDIEELKWGTDPYDPDTDGDGFNDGYEVYNLQFSRSWENRPHKFNPLIADIPKIDITLRSPPHLTMDYTTTNDERKSFSASRSQTSAQTVTTTETYDESITAEIGSNVSLIDPSISSSLSTSESFGWSKAQSRENSQSVTSAEEFARSNAITDNGGTMSVTVDISNPGNIAYTIHSLTLNALIVDPQNPKVLIPIGHLVYGKWGTFDETTLKPQNRRKLEGLVFTKNDLNLELVKQALQSRQNLIIKVSAYELEGEDGPMDLRFTEIGAKTADISIDYGSRRKPESFLVSTYTKEGRGMPLTKVMDNILRIPHRSGEFSWFYKTKNKDIVMFSSTIALRGLKDIRNFKTDTKKWARWVISHTTASRGDIVTKTYDPLVKSYDPTKISVKPGDALKLIYIEDEDKDGLGSRAEFVYGTNPKLSDTDKDGLSDKTEIEGWHVNINGQKILMKTDPTEADTDGDGISDKAEKTAKTDANEPPLGINYIKLSGSKGWDSVKEVLTDKQGHVFIGGESQGTGPLYVAKYDKHGDQIWRRSFQHDPGARDTSNLSGMAIGTDGKVYVAISEYVKGRAYKHYEKHGGKKPPLKHRNRLILRVLSAEGNKISDTILATPQTEIPRDITLDGQGNVYVSGTTSGTLTLGAKSKERARQAFVAKFDPNGKLKWAGQSDPSNCYQMTIFQGKYFAFAGSEQSTDPKTKKTTTKFTVYCQSVSTSKEFWRIHLNTSGSGRITDITADKVGNIYIGGSTNGQFPGQKSMGKYDAFVIKISPNGKVKWTKQFGTAENDYCKSLTTDSNKKLHVLGVTHKGDFRQPTRHNIGEKNDLFVATVNSLGNISYLDQIRTNYNEDPRSITTDAHGNVYAVGITNGVFPQFSMENKGGGDIFLIKFSPSSRR